VSRNAAGGDADDVLLILFEQDFAQVVINIGGAGVVADGWLRSSAGRFFRPSSIPTATAASASTSASTSGACFRIVFGCRRTACSLAPEIIIRCRFRDGSWRILSSRLGVVPHPLVQFVPVGIIATAAGGNFTGGCGFFASCPGTLFTVTAAVAIPSCRATSISVLTTTASSVPTTATRAAVFTVATRFLVTGSARGRSGSFASLGGWIRVEAKFISRFSRHSRSSHAGGSAATLRLVIVVLFILFVVIFIFVIFVIFVFFVFFVRFIRVFV
jgi:hypothetical protein